MPNSLSNQIQHTVEAALDDVARSLQKAAEDAENLSSDAVEALSKAAADVARAAEALRKHARTAANSLAQKAAHEVRDHPIATLAAAITAAAALVRVIAANRHQDT
jgi:ElaB/YqjD/DUF883 family membrane-anchored ribosome-binding protein